MAKVTGFLEFDRIEANLLTQRLGLKTLMNLYYRIRKKL